MEAKKHRNIRSGEEFNALFPKALLHDKVIKKGASVKDTVRFIPIVVKETLYQTKGISQQLKGSTIEDSCRNIWDFVYKHIRYAKDAEGIEQIRAPSRTWHDRFTGVDCDCYTVFISSILSNLKILHELRIAKYFKDYFQHIYPVVLLPNGKEIIMDCVVDKFNYEEPYSEIKNTKMDLQYLQGIDDAELLGDDSQEVGDLGKAKPKFLETLKKGLNVVNKINPATALLRNGFLITMRMNMFNVPQRLKWAYLSEADAKKKGIDLAKWKKLVAIKDKLENMHFTAGGKKEDLKKAILTGKGNKNKEVAGLFGYLPKDEVFIMNEKTPLPQLIGSEIYESEKESIQGLGELGEPITIAAVGAATAAIAALAGLIKSVGNIFPKNDSKGAEDFKNNEQEDARAAQAASTNNNTSLPTMSAASVPTTSSSALPLPVANSGAADISSNSAGDNNTKSGEGFWEKNKKWLKPTLFGIGGIGLLFGGYKLMSKKAAPTPAPSLSGTEQKKKDNSGDSKMKTIELL
jgi:hypothetical protein